MLPYNKGYVKLERDAEDHVVMRGLDPQHDAGALS
jgi:hypothetical protein